MVDLSSIVSGLQAVEHGLGIIRLMRDSNYELEKSQLKLEMAELMNALADAKIGLTSSKEQITELEREIARLSAFRERKFRNSSGAYLEVDQNDLPVDGPFCSRCADVDKIVVRIVSNRKLGPGKGFCPQCKAEYDYFGPATTLAKAREKQLGSSDS